MRCTRFDGNGVDTITWSVSEGAGGCHRADAPALYALWATQVKNALIRHTDKGQPHFCVVLLVNPRISSKPATSPKFRPRRRLYAVPRVGCQHLRVLRPPDGRNPTLIHVTDIRSLACLHNWQNPIYPQGDTAHTIETYGNTFV
jgi:hypothetical protein